MLPEIKAIEPLLKQILYGCVEHVQATKAALYISSSYDLNEKTYEIVTSYQFQDGTRKVIRDNDDLVDRLVTKRNPFFVNGLGTDIRFSEMLFHQSTDRLLAVPFFARGRLVGFIDMRDKAGRKAFDGLDLEAARKIADEVVAVLGTKNLFGIAPIPVAAPDPVVNVGVAVGRPNAPLAAPPLGPAAAPPTPALDRRYDMSQQAARAIDAARETLSKRQLTHVSGKRVLTEYDLDVVRLLLPAALAIPGAAVACFSAIGQVNNPQAIVALAAVADDAMEGIYAHLQAWLKRNNQTHLTVRPQLIYPFGAQIVPITAQGISTIISASVNGHSVEGLALTVAFERTAEPQAQRALQIFLKQIEPLVESAIAATSGRNDRQLLAERLLEPDFQKYPDLVEHSRQVAVMAQRFATLLELPPTQVETVRIAGLVHDVGIRLLDYERLYKRPNLTAEELRGLGEHPIVGAALVEPLLGPEVAQAVLRHHERVDGKGYPSRLTGNNIPLASRIIQICDAWVAMTAKSSYQMTLPYETAAQKIREGAGTQFDEQLVVRFLKSLNEIAG